MEADTSDTLLDFYSWLHANRKRVTAGAVVVVVVVAVVGFITWNKNQNETNANQALMSVPSLLVPLNPTDTPSAKALLDVAHQYSGTSAAETAQLLGARALFLDGKYADAEQEFKKFVADYATSPLKPQAEVCIAACLEAEGKTADALSESKEINAVYSSSPNIILPVKLTLGRLSEAENKPDQAVSYYKELAGIQDPNDPWVAEAHERLRLLVAKHPELMPAPQTAPVGAQPPSVMAPSPELQLTTPAGNTPTPTAPPSTAPVGTNQPPK